MKNPGAHLIPGWPTEPPSDPIEVRSFLHPWPSTPSGNAERRRGDLDCSTRDRDLRGARELRSRFSDLVMDDEGYQCLPVGYQSSCLQQTQQ
jgi:hypothetical protein